MFVGTEIVKNTYYRTSKGGLEHAYERTKTVIVFRCDCCQQLFKRDKGKMNPKRLNNSFYHVCGECDSKKFAQKKGVESRKILDMPVSSLKKLSEL